VELVFYGLAWAVVLCTLTAKPVVPGGRKQMFLPAEETVLRRD
jgi:hypothetical protein